MRGRLAKSLSRLDTLPHQTNVLHYHRSLLERRKSGKFPIYSIMPLEGTSAFSLNSKSGKIGFAAHLFVASLAPPAEDRCFWRAEKLRSDLVSVSSSSEEDSLDSDDVVEEMRPLPPPPPPPAPLAAGTDNSSAAMPCSSPPPIVDPGRLKKPIFSSRLAKVTGYYFRNH